MFNISTTLEDSASRYPQKAAFTLQDHTINFSQVNAQANAVANGLQSIGIKSGDKIGLICLNVLQFPIVYYGILKLGAVVVPINVLLKKDEITHQLTDSDCVALFCYEGSKDLPIGQYGLDAFNQTPNCQHFYAINTTNASTSILPNVLTLAQLTNNQPTTFNTAQTSAEDTAVIIYTSGTTGQAKGAELTHNNLFFNVLIAIDIVQMQTNDIQLLSLPMFHIFAMTVQMNAAIYKGIHSILLPRFDAATVFQLCYQHKISVFVGVPTMYWALLNHKSVAIADDEITANLRTCICGGASLPIKVLNEFYTRFNIPVTEGYGMSEGSPIVTFNQHQVGRKPGSIGTAVWGVQVKVVDDDGNEMPVGQKGELWYKGHNVMKGYYKKPEATAKAITDGWLHSGDIAIKDEDGFYFIVDRKTDMIIRGGKNIYPREVEDAMMKHQAISLVAVIGVPHEELGEEIKAFVVLKDNALATPDEIIAFTKEQIASYKYPRQVEILTSFPMTASGKILKKELKVMQQ